MIIYSKSCFVTHRNRAAERAAADFARAAGYGLYNPYGIGAWQANPAAAIAAAAPLWGAAAHHPTLPAPYNGTTHPLTLQHHAEKLHQHTPPTSVHDSPSGELYLSLLGL